MKRFQRIAQLLQAVANCETRPPLDSRFPDLHQDRLAEIMATAPSGSGIDNGVKLWDESTADRLTFGVSFHHMNESGTYDGWTDHKAIVTPSLSSGFNLKITGRDRNAIKDYLGETIAQWLNETSEI